jgi:hypothetical protein
MRICKVLVGKHKHAQVLGLVESPSGYKARLKYPDGSRDVVPVTHIRMLQDETVPKSKNASFWDNH